MRRLISLVSVSVALVGLGLVLWNATTVDRRPPAIKAVTQSAPGGDPRLAQTLTAIDIEFTEPVRTSTVESRFRIAPAVDGAFSWDGSTAIFTPSQKLPADSDFTISIAPGFQDLAGNADEVGLVGWAFRTVGAPVILRATPADAASGVPLDGQVELVFDRLMDTASVEAAISVTPSVPVTATWKGSVVTIDFGHGLRFGTTYTLTIAPQASDTGGSRLGVPFTTRFTTVGAGLGIAALVPGDGVAGIGIGTPIAVEFDSPINPDTARAALHIVPSIEGDIRIVARGGDSGAPASPGPSGLRSADTLVFVPSTPLAAHTTYTITLDPTVARLDDPTAVTAGRTWSFTTGAPTTSGQNQIAFLSARSGVRNVWVMNPDGTNQRQLTVELVPVSSFDTSADGGLVTFAAGGVVSVMAIDGSGLRRITIDDGRLEYAPTFTPDHSHVLLARRGADGSDLGLWLVPVPGASGDERQVLDHGAPSAGSSGLGGDGILEAGSATPWTARAAVDPLSLKAAVVVAGGTPWIVDLNPPGSVPVSAPIRVPIRADDAPIWVASGGDFYVAGSGSDGRAALYRVDLAGRVTPVGGTDGATGLIAAGPGGQLAFSVVDAAGTSHVRVVGAGLERQLPGSPGRLERWPAFSPDGATLLVGRALTAAPAVSDGIWLLDAATGAARQLTSDGAFARWIP
ncbi:MAG: Ig-like domain-containing protein [Chloroflexi bacterium]|nr:Ig-like domain-containing protein [Chloroflexota bacterium]